MTNAPILSETEQTSKPKVLVIEDNPLFAAYALTLENCDVIVAENLEKALVRLESFKPQIVLSDVNFPTRAGEQEKDQTRPVIDACLWHGIPMAFVTRADHHGLVDREHVEREPMVYIQALTPGKIAGLLHHNDMMTKVRPEFYNGIVTFRHLNDTIGSYGRIWTGGRQNERQLLIDSKTKDVAVWERAIQSVKNALAVLGIRETYDKIVLKAKADGKHLAVVDGIPRPAAEKPKTMLIGGR